MLEKKQDYKTIASLNLEKGSKKRHGEFWWFTLQESRITVVKIVKSQLFQKHTPNLNLDSTLPSTL